MTAKPPQDLAHASHVRLAYRTLLGREPSEQEIRTQLAGVTTTAELVQVLTASAEFTGTTAVIVEPSTAPARVNVWHPDLVEWTHAPGTRSEDRVAVVGDHGWLFIEGGSNSNLDQYAGTAPLPGGWADDWRALVEHRTAAAERLGVTLAMLIVPDKLAIQGADLPFPVEIAGPRPALRLVDELALPIVYPADEMLAARAGGDVYLRTDSHCSLRGNDVVHRALSKALGVPPLPEGHLDAASEYVSSGDLGRRFDPAIVEVMRSFLSMGDAEIVEDNREAVAALGGHIGSRRVVRNATAPDDRTVVIFGDSYGFCGPGYEGVSWFLAQQFREVHFIWTPFGWDERYVERVGATVVVSQTAERFVSRVPRMEVDADALVQAAVSDSAPDPDAVFGHSS